MVMPDYLILRDSQFKSIASAMVCDEKILRRLEGTVSVISEHIRAVNRSSCDSLMAGSIATYEAKDALMRQLIIEVLVGAMIMFQDCKHKEWEYIIDSKSSAHRHAREVFKKNKPKLEQQLRDYLCDFARWSIDWNTRVKAESNKKSIKEKKGGKK